MLPENKMPVSKKMIGFRYCGKAETAAEIAGISYRTKISLALK